MPTVNLMDVACSTVDACLLAAYKKVSVVPVSRCSTKRYVSHRDNNAVIAMLLHIRHWALTGNIHASDASSKVAAFAGATKGGQTRKKQQSLSYDRIFTFADLRSRNGACFVVLTQTAHESEHLLKFCRDDIVVGKVFILLELEPIRKFLSSSLPIATCSDPFIPLRLVSDHVHAVVPRVAKPGETLYFVQKNQSIKLQTMVAEERTCSCKGQLCDRQVKIESGRRGACGCLTVGRKPGFVLDQTLFLQFPADFHAEYIEEDDIVEGGPIVGSSRRMHVRNFRSWRLTKALIRNASEFSIETHDRVHLRKRIRMLVNYVNENGGWTVAGWHRRGQVIDASAGLSKPEEVDQIGSTSQNVHVSYLYPSVSGVVSSKIFQGLRYRCSDTYDSPGELSSSPESGPETKSSGSDSEDSEGGNSIEPNDGRVPLNFQNSDTDESITTVSYGTKRQKISIDDDEDSDTGNVDDRRGVQEPDEVAEVVHPVVNHG